MSKFRRLIMQSNAEPEKPNLALITEGTVKADALHSNVYAKPGVTAKRIEKGKDYFVSFDIEMNFTESSGPGIVSLGNYVPWGSNTKFYNATNSSTGTIKKHFEEVCHTIAVLPEGDAGLMVWRVQYQVGTLHISNLVITEA